MAASYSTGAATGPIDLLQKLVAWLVAQGWTSNMSAAEGTGWRAHLSKGSVYVNLRASVGTDAATNTVWANTTYSIATLVGISIYTGTGYSGASAWNAQAGGPIAAGNAAGAILTAYASAMPSYHFFDDGADNIVVVCEKTTNVYSHMGWGPSLTKAGTWTGGAYFFGTMGYFNGMANNGYPGTTLTAPTPVQLFRPSVGVVMPDRIRPSRCGRLHLQVARVRGIFRRGAGLHGEAVRDPVRPRLLIFDPR